MTYCRVTYQSEPTSLLNVRAIYMEVLSEDNDWLRGYEVNAEGERIAPKTETMPKADTRVHILHKDAIVKREAMQMNLTYGRLEPVK